MRLLITINKLAIWACKADGKYNKAIELLRLMKYDGYGRSTLSFDGVIAALYNAADPDELSEVLRWMERDNVPKSAVTYQLAIEAFDRAGK